MKNIDKKILSELLENYNRSKISYILNISTRTLDRKIKEFGLTKPNYSKKGLSDKDIKDIFFRYYHENIKQKDIANKYCISQSFVSQIINNKKHIKKFDVKITGSAKIKVNLNGD